MRDSDDDLPFKLAVHHDDERWPDVIGERLDLHLNHHSRFNEYVYDEHLDHRGRHHQHGLADWWARLLRGLL